MVAIFEIALSNAVVASLLALLAIAVGRICRRPALIHSLWLLVLLKLLTPPIIQIPIACLPTDRGEFATVLPQAGESQTTERKTVSHIVGHAGRTDEWHHASEFAEPSGVTEQPFVAALPASTSPPGRTPVSEPRPAEFSGIRDSSAGGKATPDFHLRAIVVRLSVLVWVAGSISVAVLAMIRVLRFQRLLKHGVPAPKCLCDEVERLAQRIGLKRSPTILLVPDTIPPLVWSIGRRPQLVLPEKLLQRMDPQEREAALLHELSHLRRRDHWVRFLELAAACCYWWHPVVWWARREIQWSEEACCDAWVVWHSSGGGRRYANALLAMVDFLSDSSRVVPPVASSLGRFESLKRRLTMILEGTTPQRLSGAGRSAVFVVAVCSLPFWPRVGVERTTASENRAATDKPAAAIIDSQESSVESESGMAQSKLDGTRSGSKPSFPEPIEFETKPRSFDLDVQRIRSVAYSNDGKHLAVAHGDYFTRGAVRIWDVREMKEVAVWKEPRGLYSVHISPDGRFVASSHYGDGQVRIRSIDSGEEIIEISTGDMWAQARFAPDGETLVTASTKGRLKLWNVADGKELENLASLPVRLQCVAFSRDGSRIVAGGGPVSDNNSGWAGVWDIASGKLIAEMKDIPVSVVGIAISPNGKLLATAGHDGVARLWEAKTGTPVATFSANRGELEWVDFSPNGELLVCGSLDETAKLWSVDSGQLVATLRNPDGNVRTVRFSPDGHTLATAGQGGVVRLWDAATHQQIGTLEPAEAALRGPSPVLSIACSRDGKVVASSHEDKTVRLRDVRTGDLQRILNGHDAEVSCVTFSPDSRLLATASCDNTVKLWVVADGRERQTLTGHTDWVLSATFAPDGKTIASSGCDNMIRLWDVDTGNEKARLKGHTQMVRCLAFSPCGKLLASGSADQTVKLWDVQSQNEVATVEGRHGGALAFSPDGNTLASVGADGTIILRNVKTGNERRMLNEPRGGVWCLAFSPRGRTLASGSSNGTIALWDSDSATLRSTLQSHTNIVTSLAFIPDTCTLFSGGADQSIKLWKAKGTRIPPVDTLQATDEGARCRFAVFTPDGRWMITAGDDKAIRLWDLNNGQLSQKDRYRGGTPICGDLSPDGKLLATGTYGDSVHLWDVEAGHRIGEITTSEMKLLDVDFSPDGSQLAVASGSGTVSVWDVESKQKFWRSKAQRLPVTTVEFSPNGKTIVTTTGDWQKPKSPGTVTLWEAESGRALAHLPFQGGDINCARFSSDGRLLVTSGSSDAKLKAWDVESHELRSTAYRVAGVSDLATLPGGDCVLAGQWGRGVSLWNINSGQFLAEYPAATDATSVCDVSCSPDGSLIAGAGLDGTVTLWPTTPSASHDAETSAGRIRAALEAGDAVDEN